MSAGVADPSTAGGQRSPRRELLAHYAAVLRAAWQGRTELTGPARLTEERAFLPAALSLQETPPHPAPRRAAFVLCGLFIAALAWAWFGQLDVVAVAPGRIIVGERSKLIQPLETAVVRAIHVRDGDVVTVGQLLVELDPTASQADGSRVTEARRAALGEALRTQALLASSGGKLDSREPPEPQIGVSKEQAFDGWRAEDRAAAALQLQAEWQEHRARLARLGAERARRNAELDTAQEVVAKLKAMLPLVRQREADYQGLTQQGFMSGHAGQDRMRERIELERDLSTARARIAESQAGLAESRRGQAAYLAEARRSWQDRLTQARQKLADLAQEQTKTGQRSQQTRLTSPVAGTVQQLAIHTTGGVVTPAQALMVVVPDTGADNASPIAEISIENKDIGFVQSGQSAEVKLETFNYTRYGTVPATVQWVTADAVVRDGAADGKTDSSDHRRAHPIGQAVFSARLVLGRADLNVDGRTVRLTPGLNLTAEVKTGKRRVIDYLLSPVQRSVGESMRER